MRGETSNFTRGIRRALAASMVTLLVTATSPAAFAQEYSEEFRLGPGENSRDWVYTFSDPHTAALYGSVKDGVGSVVLDTTIPPACRSRWELKITERGVVVHRGPEYRTVLQAGAPQGYPIIIDPVRVNDDFTYNEAPYLRDCEVTVRLYRPVNLCVMSAKVGGDLGGSYFGDFAYFNYFEDGAPITFGNAMDPATLALLDGLTSGLVFGEPPEDAGGQQPPSFAKAMQQWAAESEADGEAIPGAGDKFGLTLVGITGGGGSTDTSLAGALAMMSSFSLAASAPGGELEAWLKSPDGEPWVGDRRISLSVVHMAPGDRDANLEGVKFVGQAGNPGQAYVEVYSPSPNVLAGTLVADLLSVNRYQQGRLRVHVEASFRARRGALSCDWQ